MVLCHARGPRRFAAGLVVTCLCVSGTVVSSGPVAAGSLPDLKVTKGSVAISGLGDRITGRFTVRNAGGSRARSSTAYVKLRQGGRYRYLTELRILRLAGGRNAKYAFRAATPTWLAPGSHAVRVCLDVKRKVRESREGNNCRTLGSITGILDGPIEHQPDKKWFVPGYYGWVPSGYDGTPSALLVWLHGCGGQSRFDIETYHPAQAEDFVMIAPTDREGDCWKTPESGAGDDGLVLAAIADVSQRFNIDPGRVVLGGYSSGGDLSYRVAYRHSAAIDAVLASNTAPFRDTGVPAAEAIQPATTRFRIVHLAHTEDEVYPIETVRAELQTLVTNGFPVTSIERPGGHYDDPGENGLPGTDADIRELLLPEVDP